MLMGGFGAVILLIPIMAVNMQVCELHNILFYLEKGFLQALDYDKI